jgi:hypothetical protein
VAHGFLGYIKYTGIMRLSKAGIRANPDKNEIKSTTSLLKIYPERTHFFALLDFFSILGSHYTLLSHEVHPAYILNGLFRRYFKSADYSLWK